MNVHRLQLASDRAKLRLDQKVILISFKEGNVV